MGYTTVEKPETELDICKLRDSFADKMRGIRDIIVKDVETEKLSEFFVKTLEYILKLENYRTYDRMMYVYKMFLNDMIDLL